MPTAFATVKCPSSWSTIRTTMPRMVRTQLKAPVSQAAARTPATRWIHKIVVELPTMAYVVARPSGAWEIRESRTTTAGPRSRTLATFRTLTPEVVEHARARASRPLDSDDLRRAALRAGAPTTAGAPNQAAGELVAELMAGRRPRPALVRLLRAALDGDDQATSASARSAARWITASPQRRGEALRDLLLLTDKLPASRAPAHRRFPRVRSAPA